MNFCKGMCFQNRLWFDNNLFCVIFLFVFIFGSLKNSNSQTFDSKQVFDYTGADQPLVIPPCITQIKVKVWGGGGGGSTYSGQNAGGGAGGYVEGTIAVSTGDVFTIMVGEGAACDGTPDISSYGFGGAPYSTDQYGGYGGGLSGVFTNNTPITAVDYTRALLIAGGGGGGERAGANTYCTSGGQGGDAIFGGGMPDMQGDQSAPGIGGGAGGGYRGGLKTLRLSGNGIWYAGEGGLNYIDPIVTNGVTLSSTDFGNWNAFPAMYMDPPNTADPDYTPFVSSASPGIGTGSMYTYSRAGHGRIVIEFYSSPVTTSNDTLICEGNSTTLTVSGGSSYLWNTGATTASLTVAPTAPTTYTVTETSTGCVDSVTVNVNPKPDVTVNSETICFGETALLVANGAAMYSWSTGSSNSSISVTPLTTTPYTVIGTTNGCTDTATVSVTVTSLPVISVNDTTICNGGIATLTAGGGTTYSWSTGATTTSIDVLPVIPTTYTVVGTTNGCSDSAIASVTVNPLPIITVNSETICAGQTAVLTVSGGVTYNWSTGATTDSIAVSPVIPTTYTVVGTTNGCSGSVVASVTVNPLPIIAVNSETICAGQTTVLTVGGGATYNWSTGATTDSIAVSPVIPTTYTVVGTTNGCSDSAIASVTVIPLPVISVNSEVICIGQTTVIIADGGTTYSWSSGATIDSITVSPVIPTTYTVVGTTNGCSDSAVATVTVNPLPILTITAVDPVCNGACTGQTVVIPSGGTAPYTYSWTGGCTTAICTGLCPGSYTVTVTDAFGCNSETDTLIAEPPALSLAVTNYTLTNCVDSCDAIATVLASGGTPGAGYVYSWNTVPVQINDTASNLCSGTYTCTVTDANNCTSTATVAITEPAPLVLVVNTSPTACVTATGTATVIATGGTAGYTYLWNASGQTTATSTGLVNGNYTVTVADANGCQAAQTGTVAIAPNPLVTATAMAYTIVEGNSTQISATGGISYQWSPSAGLTCDTCQSTQAAPIETSTYCVTVADTNGCSDTTCLTIVVEEPCPSDYKVPNAFSPNNDGYNDKFCLQGWSNCVSGFSILIFDRWGEKVFESDNPGFCWDGKYTSSFKTNVNENMNSAVFIYSIEAVLNNGEELRRKGNISLIK